MSSLAPALHFTVIHQVLPAPSGLQMLVSNMGKVHDLADHAAAGSLISTLRTFMIILCGLTIDNFAVLSSIAPNTV